jgi:hypothetical protein
VLNSQATPAALQHAATSEASRSGPGWVRAAADRAGSPARFASAASDTHAHCLPVAFDTTHDGGTGAWQVPPGGHWALAAAANRHRNTNANTRIAASPEVPPGRAAGHVVNTLWGSATRG